MAVALMLAGAVAELLTIGAVLPFLAIILETHEATNQSGFISEARRLLQMTGGDIVVTASLFLIIAAILAASIRLLLNWVTQSFVCQLGHEIGQMIYSRMLRQPYSYHALRNSSEMISGIEKVQMVVFGLLLPLIQAFTAAIIVLFIGAAMLAIHAQATIVAAAAMTLIYLGVSLASRQRIQRNAKIIAAMHTRRVKQIQEGLGGIRDIIIERSQLVFERAFRNIDKPFRRAQAVNMFLGTAPRFIVESAGIALLALLALYFSTLPGGILAGLPVIGALAVGAQRLLPLLQQMYTGWNQFASNRHNLVDVIRLMQIPADPTLAQEPPHSARPMQEGAKLEHVSFRYGPGPYVLEDISFEIPIGCRVGIIGQTGSGKSTLVDLLMGLLEPTEGKIYIDGQPLERFSKTHWQQQIAHVPQSLYLSDSSIAANIAFGQGEKEIDGDRIVEAARQAEIDSFIRTLPDGYDTLVGERGVRLSGGQRQRIGIARALYKRANVLIFDEATSALDQETEASIVATLASFRRELTLVMISHRLTTLSSCDRIIHLANGKVTESGSYDEVVGPRSALA